MGGGQHPLTRRLLGYCEGQKTQLDVISTPRLDYANVGWTQQQCACPLSQQRPVNPIEGTSQAHTATMGDKYQFSISKRRRPSLWTKMMSKQGVQFRAADLLTMSPSKGPKMPLHTLMGLRVHLAYVLAHFARRLLLSRNSAFSSQNSIRENISLHFLLRKIFPGWLKILRRMWIRDAKLPLFWMSPHGKVSTPPLQLPGTTCNAKAS